MEKTSARLEIDISPAKAKPSARRGQARAAKVSEAMVAIMVASPLPKLTSAALTSSVSSRKEAADAVPRMTLRESCDLELMRARSQRCTTAPAIHPADAIDPSTPM